MPATTTILVVDDDPDVRSATVTILVDAGYRVLQAIHGADALAQLAAHDDVAAVVLDLMMPTMSGPELLERMDADKRLRRIPVLVLTASDGYMHVRGREILKKPYELDELVSTMRRILMVPTPA